MVTQTKLYFCTHLRHSKNLETNVSIIMNSVCQGFFIVADISNSLNVGIIHFINLFLFSCSVLEDLPTKCLLFGAIMLQK